jgi:signal transduction histidine kinase
MSIILRDITDRKRREEEIRQLNFGLLEQVDERTRELAEKVDQLARANAELQQLDRTRSEFVSLVSHQLRAPTNMLRQQSILGQIPMHEQYLCTHAGYIEPTSRAS